MITRIFLTLIAVMICGITQADDKKLIQDGKVTVIDVRTPDEYKLAHISGSKNVDFIENDFEKNIGQLDKSKSYLVHCASGHRSGKALEIFQKLGFVSVYHLDNGLKGWEAAGKPVTK